MNQRQKNKFPRAIETLSDLLGKLITNQDVDTVRKEIHELLEGEKREKGVVDNNV